MRQVLRFPVGKEFKKILEDDHEWYVITNLRLKPIVLKRGKPDSIPQSTAQEAIDELKQKTFSKEYAIRVFLLHTHPRTRSNAPSDGDLRSFFRHKINNPYQLYGIIPAGFGIITKKGIFIIKLPENPQTLKLMEEPTQILYKTKRKDYYKNKLNKNTFFEAYEHAQQNMEKSERTALEAEAHEKTFKKVLKTMPELKTRMIRRTHRSNMRRWR